MSTLSTHPTPTAHTVAVVGTGLIGAGWTLHFLAQGLNVIASDPAEGAEERLRNFVRRHWGITERLGRATSARQDRLRFDPDLGQAVAQADFVQENGPEDASVKTRLFAAMDEAAAPTTILASSSSGLPASRFQTECRHPERVLIGHPFNPPHVIPLVEVVGGALTSPEAIASAMAFYTATGKRPIHVRREKTAHVANRLQAAVWREAYGLVDDGVVSLEDIDIAMTQGLGPRWALQGPFATQRLAGGEGGMRHSLDHLGAHLDAWWQDLYATRLTPELKERIVTLSDAATVPGDAEAMLAERDALLQDVLLVASGRRHLP